MGSAAHEATRPAPGVFGTRSIGRRAGFAFACVLALAARSQELRLLTDNGLTNEKWSTYKEAPRPRTGGRYTANPAFTSGAGDGGSVAFSEGRLTNGDASFSYKRRPNPYSYWQGTARAEVEFDLLKPFRIRRARVCLLNSGPHGTATIEVFARGDPLEFPDLLKLASQPAVDGWNEFAQLNCLADGLRFRFTGAEGKTYITVSEVEIWGETVPAAEAPVAPRRTSTKSIREGDIEWCAFDFGPAASPVFANFSAVPKDAVYTEGKGYGWLPYSDGQPGTPSNFGPESQSVPGLGERDRAGKGKACADSLYRDLIMTSEYYHTQVRQSFVVDLPNGRYRVATYHGDFAFGRPGEQVWWIEAEGQRVVEKLAMPPSLRAEAGFEVEVTDGQLTLTFDAAHPKPASRGFLLNGLVVLPAGTPAQREFADGKLAKIRAALQRERDDQFDAVFTENPYVEEAEMPPFSQADNDRGFVPFVPQWMTNVYPNSVPRSEDLRRPLTCFACPGEYEPMTVALRAVRDLESVSCEVSDLAGPGDLPASAFDVRSVRCWRQRLGSSWSTEWRVMPELLEKKASVDVSADSTHEFWLTVHVPPGTPAGVYSGTATLKTANAGRAEIPLSVEVLPFTLQENERPVGMYWYDQKAVGTPLCEAQVRDMIAHGMTTLTKGGVFPEVRDVDGKPVLDTGPLRRVLQELSELGIKGPIPYHNSGLMKTLRRTFPGKTDADYDAMYVESIRQLEVVSARPDTPKLLYYPVDEIGNHKERGERANHECSLIAKVPGATSYITVNNYAAGETWGDTFDIWCGNIVYTAEQEQRLLARGKRYMRYGSAYLNDPRKARNSCGFGFYRRPAETMFYWHYQAYRGDPYDDFDSGSRDWCAVYPGRDGELIPTTDWEGLREGIDDMRTIATLKHYAARAATSPAGKLAAERALKTLDDVLGGDAELSQTGSRGDLSNDEFHALRRRLVDRILELHAVVGSPPAAPALPPLAEYVCRHTATPPRIDGKLDDEAWRRVPAAVELSWCYGTKTGPPVHATRAKLCWDKEALYVSFQCDDPDVWSTITQRDGPLWEGEVVEVYIDPDGDGLRYKELEVNPLNTVIDLDIGKQTNYGIPAADVARFKQWDAAGWLTAVTCLGTTDVRDDTDRGWQVEMAIPMSCFADSATVPPRPGDRWRLQLYRIDRSADLLKPEFSAWSPTTTFHRPDRFGVLVFGGPSTGE